MSKEKERSSIPSWLETPTKTLINPPVDTRIQELPFGELEWEDFERLCLRLVRIEREVEHCQLYGTRGQDQEGIDLYAKRVSEKYFVYQCKRVKGFGPASIKAAVDKFLEGEWVSKTDTFVLCTSESMVPTERSNEIEVQRKILNKEGIRFVSWDKETLSAKLKDLPKLVDDFFGRAWVEKFCGSEKVQELGSRLDSRLVIEFRERMRSFYKRVFQTHDPGLPTATHINMSSVALENRFVIPEIIDRRTINLVNNIPDSEQKYNEEFPSAEPKLKESRKVTTRVNTTFPQRQDLESWLSNNNGHSIILGGPGSGKSTLLRNIAIDLLSNYPKLSNISKKWGLHLPVWLPFALWTKYISESQAGVCSIKDVLKGWLKSWDEERLWPLVEHALDDKRLILLVDGLDEWTNEQSARIALDRLTVFVQQRNIPVILTSRPHGFERIGFGAKEWEIGELSNFSNSQQKELLGIWFTLWYENNKDSQQITVDEITRRTRHSIDHFMSELQKSSDLRELAKVPLLLSLLILLKINDARLPQNRFKAYDKLIELLITTHPQRRIAAAGVQVNQLLDLTEDEIKMIMSFLAFTIHEKHNEGIISGSEAILQLESYLKDEEIGLGLEKREALRISRAIINLGEGSLGLLVSKSPTEIGFFHRAFQEFLASYYLYTSNRQKQLQIIESNCTNSQWHEVILGLFFINNRPEDIRDYTKVIKEKEVSDAEDFNKKLLLYEATFGSYNMPVSLAKEYCKEAFNEIETGHWMPYRERVLKIVIDGLKSSRLKEMIKEKITEWFPNRKRRKDRIINIISGLEDKDNQFLTYLQRGIFDEEFQNKRAALNVISKKYKNNKVIGDFLVGVIKGPRDSTTKALVIEGLTIGWPEHHEINSILEFAGKSISPELRFSSVKAKIARNTHDKEDLDILLGLASSYSSLNYHFRDEVADLILKGWPKNPEVLSVCLKSVKNDFSGKIEIEKEISIKVLLNGYSEEEDVLNYCLKEIREESHPFLLFHNDAWSIISEKYQGNKFITDAIDTWLQKKHHDDVILAYTTLASGSEIAKNILLEEVQNSSFPHLLASALLEGWGMQDDNVAAALTTIVNESDLKASNIGHLIPKIIQDKDMARSKLMQLIQNQFNIHLNFLLIGLDNVWDHSIENDIKEHLLNIVKLHEDDDSIFSNRIIAINFLIRKFSEDSRVKELAMQEISKRNGLFESTVEYYSSEPKIQNSLLKIGFPLPDQLRLLIANLLGEGIDQDEFNVSLLSLYDYDVNPLVKTQSSISFHKHIKLNENKVTNAVEILSKTIVCYGMDYTERRQAAFCGLATLNKLEVFLNAEEKIESIKTSHVPLTNRMTTNIPFLKNLLENWNYITSCIGEDITTRFSKFERDPLHFWEEISLVISDDYPEPKRDIIDFLENRTERTIKPNLLKLLSKERPKSSLLLEYLFEALKQKQKHRFDHDNELIYTASRILSKQFKYDTSVLKTIREFALDPKLNEAAIVAMCEGWPSDESIKKILDYVREKEFGLSYMTYFELVSITSSADSLFGIIINLINDKGKLFIWNKEETSRPILRRIRENDELYFKLLDKLNNQPTPIEKANITKFIAASRGVSPELRKWITEQLNEEWNDDFCQDVEDLLLGEIRPMVHILLEV